jgi:hypothetical protein
VIAVSLKYKASCADFLVWRKGSFQALQDTGLTFEEGSPNMNLVVLQAGFRARI